MTWILWAALLVLQNYSFTYVSRARNSASLWRHLKAAQFSNGVWFVSQIFIVGRLMDILTGKEGLWMAIFTGLFYMTFTTTGSLLAHWQALRTESGKDAVGASAKYAQITKEEWEVVKSKIIDDPIPLQVRSL
jgi:hypothetical protein